MLPEPVRRTLYRASARLIRDTKVEMQADWEVTFAMPSVVSVRRGFDLVADAQFATITVRSAIPATMKWNA